MTSDRRLPRREFRKADCLTIILALVVCQLPCAVWSDETRSIRESAIVKAVQSTQSAIAAVYVQKGNTQGSGSGSVIDPRGYVLTAKHVVGDNHVVLLRGRPPMRAELIGEMPEFDLAILKLGKRAFNRPASPEYPLDGTPLDFIRLGSVDEIMLGETILNIGNPGGRGIVVTRGIISSLGIYGGNALAMATQSSNGFNQHLQFDAASNPGNSGGPLINVVGQQVGLVTSSIRGEEGIHFAVPPDTIRGAISELLRPELRQRYVSGMKVDAQQSSVIVGEVESDSPADDSGILHGDEIVAIDGRELRDVIDWEFTRLELRPNQEVKLDLVREGKEVVVKLKLAKRKPMPSLQGIDALPGLLCRAAAYDPQVGSPLDDDDRPTKQPMVEPVVTATPSGLARREHFELQYEGLLQIENTGVHRIAIKSDDGSKLYVHDHLVVDNNGNHADQIRTGWVDLAAGMHPIRIEYYEDEGDENLELLIAEGDNELQSVPAGRLFHLPVK